ncbi:hypothetical protein NDU88_004944 [Pleurodeles waltl]|uniref:Uncharacterized protein n=1 Tax=Pleurodeles waltl TaxID=8319 RepID=A0AAV7VM58_PLEWA|nr:hypothetical protein NDU88_004944 [Pleurodeles waltl]
MGYYTEVDEYFQDLPELAEDHHMEERLVEALGHHVQDSVNKARIKALKPYTQSLMRSGQCEFRGRALPENGSKDDQTADLGIAQRASRGPACQRKF